MSVIVHTYDMAFSIQNDFVPSKTAALQKCLMSLNCTNYSSIMGVPTNCNNNPTHHKKNYLQTTSKIHHYHTTHFGAMFDLGR
jgi:hypothetical protein